MGCKHVVTMSQHVPTVFSEVVILVKGELKIKNIANFRIYCSKCFWYKGFQVDTAPLRGNGFFDMFIERQSILQ